MHLRFMATYNKFNYRVKHNKSHGIFQDCFNNAILVFFNHGLNYTLSYYYAVILNCWSFVTKKLPLLLRGDHLQSKRTNRKASRTKISWSPVLLTGEKQTSYSGFPSVSTDSHMSLCSVEEFNSGLLHLLKTRLQSLHLQEETVRPVFKKHTLVKVQD